MLHSNAIDSMFSEVGTTEKLFKPRSLNGAFCRNLKQLICTIKSIKMCPKNITCRPAGGGARALHGAKCRALTQFRTCAYRFLSWTI